MTLRKIFLLLLSFWITFFLLLSSAYGARVNDIDKGTFNEYKEYMLEWMLDLRQNFNVENFETKFFGFSTFENIGLDL